MVVVKAAPCTSVFGDLNATRSTRSVSAGGRDGFECRARYGMPAYQPVDTNIKCVRAAIERLDGGRDILRSLDFDCVDFESERASRRLNLAQLR
jgi:hypothetical protein